MSWNWMTDRLFPKPKTGYDPEEDAIEGESGAKRCGRCRRWVPDECVKMCPYCEARL